LNKHWVGLILLLLACLMLGAGASGCALVKQDTTTSASEATSTTVTTVAGTDAASVANNAIQTVTKSASIVAPQTLKSGTLQVGADTAFAPMEYPQGKGTYAGFDVDLCTAIAKKLGLTLEIVPTAYGDLVPSLLGDKFDLIMSAMHITPDLQQQIAFSDPYLPGTLAIACPSGAPIADEAGLSGKRVGVQTGSIGQLVVDQLAGLQQVTDYNTVPEAFKDLVGGRLDAVVNDEIVNAYVEANLTEFKDKITNSGTIDTQYGYGYGFKPGSDLITAVNAALQELRTDQVYQKICAKWGVTGN
jgi:ABC-type amino acid transport substrate-binding protein